MKVPTYSCRDRWAATKFSASVVASANADGQLTMLLASLNSSRESMVLRPISVDAKEIFMTCRSLIRQRKTCPAMFRTFSLFVRRFFHV